MLDDASCGNNASLCYNELKKLMLEVKSIITKVFVVVNPIVYIGRGYTYV